MIIGENRNNIVRFYIEKSLQTFEDAELLALNERWNSCVNRLYYSAFYIVYALLISSIDVRSKTHNGIKFLFHENFIHNGKIDKEFSRHYTYLSELRSASDYEDFEILYKEEVEPLIDKTKDFIDTLRNLIPLN